MPANPRAMRATNIYREHTATLRARAQAITTNAWRLLHPDDLDGTHRLFMERIVPGLTQLQHTAARLSGGYLAAYVAVSHGQPPTTSGASADVRGIGESRAGKPLPEALTVPLITVKTAIARGRDPEQALELGRQQAVRNASEDVIHIARAALFDGFASHDEIVGWRRVTSGGCGACLALTDGTILADEDALDVHDGCQCTGEPVVRGVRETVQRATGHEIFESWTPEQQNAALGPDKAALIRDGDAPFHALVARSPMVAVADQITEAPLEALHH